MATQAMKLNKKYLTSTYALNIENKLVEVIGIINYEESLRTGFDVATLAINEKIISDDYEEYFKNMEFYKCRILDGVSDSEIVVLWSEIINWAKTTVVEDFYNYKLSLKVNIPTSGIRNMITEKDIKAELIAKAQEFGVDLTFKSLNGDANSTIDILNERIAQCENVLRSLQALSVITPTLDKLHSEDLNKKIVKISENIDGIVERLDTIATGLS